MPQGPWRPALSDEIARAVNERYDVRGSDLSQLIAGCPRNGNVISKRRRDQFGSRVPGDVFDLIERLAVRADSSRGEG